MEKNIPTEQERQYVGKWRPPLNLVSWDGGENGEPEFEPKYDTDPREELFTTQNEKERKKAYYHAHRDKIVSKKKMAAAKKAAAECQEKGLPVMLAPYIRFYEETKYLKDPVGLKFDSIHELLLFLKDVRTKDQEFSLEQLAELIHRYDNR